MCIAGLSVAQNYNNFSMTWNFCNADGTLDRAWNDYCRGQSVYVKNKSLYGVTQSTPNGYHVPALSGTYRVYNAVGNSNGMAIYDIPASTWAYNQVAEIPLGSNQTFDYASGLNIRIEYIKANNETIITWFRKYMSMYLKTRTVSVNAGPDITICSGEAISATPSGASTYSWSPALPATGSSFFGSTTTTYTVTGSTTFTTHMSNPMGSITCSATDAMDVTVHPLPILFIQKVILCTGDPLPVLSAPSGMVSYSWKRNGLPLAGQTSSTLNTAPYGYGNYTYTFVNANGCSGSATINVSLNVSAAANLNANFSSVVSNAGSGNINIDVNASGGCEHQWTLYNSNANGDLLSWAIASFWSSSTGYTFANLPSGQYYAVVHSTRCLPCNETKTYQRLYFETRRAPLPSGNIQEAEFQVFPNPSQGVFTVTVPDAVLGTVDVLDVTGKKVYTRRLAENTNSHQIDLTAFPKGVYVINMDVDGVRLSKKIVLE